MTSAGRLDVALMPAGTEGFADLVRNAVRFDVFGVELFVASLADILRSKEAADRPQDRHDVVVLREMLRRKGLQGEHDKVEIRVRSISPGLRLPESLPSPHGKTPRLRFASATR